MKNIIITICSTFLIISIFSCNKAQTNTIVGKWNLINDSGSLPIANTVGFNYIGTAKDYYDFNANGTLYINENSLLDTGTFSMKANNEIDIVFSNGSLYYYYIKNLTAHTATLTDIFSMGPTRIIKLRK